MANAPFQWSSAFLGQGRNQPAPGTVRTDSFGGFGGFNQTGSTVGRPTQQPSQTFGNQPRQQANRQPAGDFRSQFMNFLQQNQRAPGGFQQGAAPRTDQGMGGLLGGARPPQSQMQRGQQIPTLQDVLKEAQGRPSMEHLMSRLIPGSMGQQQQAPRAGDFLAEAAAVDYLNRVSNQQRLGGQMQGVIGGVNQVPGMGMMGIDMAQQAGQQGEQIARDASQNMMQQAQQGTNVYNQTRGDVQSSLGKAQAGMQQGIDTAKQAIQEHDFFRKDTVASGVNAIQSQMKQARDRIMSDPNLSDADRQVELANIDNMARQQASSYAAEQDQQAAVGILNARNALAGMQSAMGSNMGALGLQGAGLSSGVGMQATGMNLQAAQAGAQLMTAQNQYYSSLAQSALANAIQANLSGNVTAAQLYQSFPLDVQIAPTILAMQNAQGLRPGSQLSGPFSGRMAGLLGNMQFAGYGENQF